MGGYQVPCLDIQGVRRVENGMEVESARGVFTLHCRDLDRDLLAMLAALRDPDSGLWTAVRARAEGTAELLVMLGELDRLGLVRERSGRTAADSDSVGPPWPTSPG
jgi:hypothetical protein